MDEFQFRNDARKLGNLYRDLDTTKYQSLNTNTERTSRPAPGPSLPGQDWAITLDADMCDRLMEITCDVRTHITPGVALRKDGPHLCEYLALHAQPISELDFADDVHDEVRDQIRHLIPKLHPDNAGDIAARPERYQTARSILTRLQAMGHHITPDQLRKWGERGHITTRDLSTRGRGYRMSEVLEHIRGRG